MIDATGSALQRLWLASIGLLLLAGAASAQDRELRVCADPNNLPFSNQRLEGIENKLAQLIAEDMNATVRYTWHPQRRGFIRRTLKAGACDVVMSVPSGYDLVLATKPYYRSSYVFVYPASRDLRLRSFDDPALRDLRIGLHAFGDDGANAPPAHALTRRGIVGNVVGFPMWGVDSVESPPGRIIGAVATGEVDVAIVWGPFGGYFAQFQPVDLEVVPVSPQVDQPTLPFIFDISMGVRPGDEALKEELEAILDRRRDDVRRILEAFGVPLVGAGDPAPRL